MSRWRRGARKHELTPTFDELVLISKSLQAVKTLGALPPQDELLEDSIAAVDQALDVAVQERPASRLPIHSPRTR